MKLQQGAYVILKLSNKPELARCTVADGDSYKAVLEKEKDKDEKHPSAVNFSKTDVMAILGKKPKVGSVYGLKIEPLIRRASFKGFSYVRIYNWFDDEQMRLLEEGLEDAYEQLKKLRVTGQFKFELEVRQPQGKFAGMYKYRPKAETDIIIVKPELTMEGLDYIVFHEYAHGIWYRMMTPKMRLWWVKLYHEYIKLQQIKEAELKSILGEVESSEGIRSFQREADDETKVQLKEVVKHIMNVHSLSINHLEMMLENGESIAEYWPTSLEMSEKEEAITDYAKKSPEEFFAEAIAHKFSGRKLPKKVEELYSKTMSRLVKGGVETAEDAEEKPSKKKDKTKDKKKDKSKASDSVRFSQDAPDEDAPKKKKKKKKKEESV